MQGLEISKKYFDTYGMPMLEGEFSHILPYLAVGNVGKGSDRLGFDDEISKDHDFEPGFCIFLPDENILDRKTAFSLERAYSKLPKEFMGLIRQPLSPVGGNRHGVMRTSDFYASVVFSPDGDLDVNTWLNIPQFLLSEAVNGEVYFDNLGEFTAIRNRLLNMPLDIKFKRISKSLLQMGQSGQYNYLRCLAHNENASAQLALYEFVKNAMEVIFLLNNQYMPYYKWSFKALKHLPYGEKLANDFSYLITNENRAEVIEKKHRIIENTAQYISSLLCEKGYIDENTNNLEKLAYLLNNKIKDGYIRNYAL